jgi:hypothetical protein
MSQRLQAKAKVRVLSSRVSESLVELDSGLKKISPVNERFDV